MIKPLIIKFLLIIVSYKICLSSNIDKFYDLDHVTFTNTHHTSTQHKGVVFLREKDLPESLVKYIKQNIALEHTLRKACSDLGNQISESTNIAQVCLHVIDDTQQIKTVNIAPAANCLGTFYLSGDQPLTVRSAKISTTPYTHTQTIVLNSLDTSNKSSQFVQILQRQQIIFDSLIFNLEALNQYTSYLSNPQSIHRTVEYEVQQKIKEVQELLHKKQGVTQEIKTSISNRTLLNSDSNMTSIERDINSLTISLMRRICSCLEANDFGFYMLGDTRNDESVKALTSSILKQFEQTIIGKDEKIKIKKVNDILNSKNFNLACSEPLLLHDISQDAKIPFIAKKLQPLLKDATQVIIHIHSTKTPCKSCLTNCYKHLLDSHGAIRKYQDMIKTKKDIPVYFLISYHQDYLKESEYDFVVPTTLDVELGPSKLLLFKTN